jgi:hypothetical protein
MCQHGVISFVKLFVRARNDAVTRRLTRQLGFGGFGGLQVPGAERFFPCDGCGLRRP